MPTQGPQDLGDEPPGAAAAGIDERRRPVPRAKRDATEVVFILKLRSGLSEGWRRWESEGEEGEGVGQTPSFNHL